MERRTILAGGGSVGLAGLSGLSGCSTFAADLISSGRSTSSPLEPSAGEWPQWAHYGPRRNRYNPHATPPRSEPAIAWSHETDGYWRGRQVAIADGTVFGRSDTALSARAADDGAVLWRTSQSSGGYVFYVDGRLYHGGEERAEAVTLDGEVAWRLDDENAIIVGESDSHVYTFADRRTGWHDPETGDRVGRTDANVTPIIVTDRWLYGFTDDELVAYRDDGDAVTRQWSAPYGGSEMYGWFVLADERLYVNEHAAVAATQHGPKRPEGNDVLSTYGLDGDRLRREPWDETHVIEGLVVADGVEYLLVNELDPDGGYGSAHLIAREGDKLWRESFPAPATEPVVTSDSILVTAGDATLLAFDRANGELRWRLDGVGGELAAVKETIYVAGDRFSALRA